MITYNLLETKTQQKKLTFESLMGVVFKTPIYNKKKNKSYNNNRVIYISLILIEGFFVKYDYSLMT